MEQPSRPPGLWLLYALYAGVALIFIWFVGSFVLIGLGLWYQFLSFIITDDRVGAGLFVKGLAVVFGIGTIAIPAAAILVVRPWRTGYRDS